MKYKNIQLSMAIFFISWGGVYAQEVVLAAGGNATDASGSLSYSIGQIAYVELIESGGFVTQGVQQYEIQSSVTPVVAGLEDIEKIKLSVFPNPVVDHLQLKVLDEQQGDWSYALFNIHGKLVESKDLAFPKAIVSMEGLPSSSYYLRVFEDRKQVKTFKIIKQ